MAKLFFSAAFRDLPWTQPVPRKNWRYQALLKGKSHATVSGRCLSV